MPTLGLAFWLSSRQVDKGIRAKVLLALAFAMAGDVFLMLEGLSTQYANLFLFGVGSFLITHLLYILIFNQIAKSDWQYLLRQPQWMLVAAFFLIAMLTYLWPDLPAGLNVAVLIYSTCIVLMALAAVNAFPGFSPTAFRMLILGVLCFVFSDSIIALSKFKATQLSIPNARLIIMFLYLLGQGLIVKGLLMYLLSNKDLDDQTVDQVSGIQSTAE